MTNKVELKDIKDGDFFIYDEEHFIKHGTRINHTGKEFIVGWSVRVTYSTTSEELKTKGYIPIKEWAFSPNELVTLF